MPKYKTKDLEAFAEKYPQLVRTKVVLDGRKITMWLKIGMPLPDVEITEGEPEEEENVPAQDVPAFIGKAHK